MSTICNPILDNKLRGSRLRTTLTSDFCKREEKVVCRVGGSQEAEAMQILQVERNQEKNHRGGFSRGGGGHRLQQKSTLRRQWPSRTDLISGRTSHSFLSDRTLRPSSTFPETFLYYLYLKHLQTLGNFRKRIALLYFSLSAGIFTEHVFLLPFKAFQSYGQQNNTQAPWSDVMH